MFRRLTATIAVLAILLATIGAPPPASAAKQTTEKPQMYEPAYVKTCRDWNINNRWEGSNYYGSVTGLKAAIDIPVGYFVACGNDWLGGYGGSSAWISLEPLGGGSQDIIQVGIAMCEGGSETDSPCYGAAARSYRYFWAWGDAGHRPRPIDLGPASNTAVSFSIKHIGNVFQIRGPGISLDVTDTNIDWRNSQLHAAYNGETWDLNDQLGQWGLTDWEKLIFTSTAYIPAGGSTWTNTNWSGECNASGWYYDSTHYSVCSQSGTTVKIANYHGD